MPQTLAARPDIIVETFDSTACETINRMVRPLGYRVYAIDEGTGGLIPQETLLPRNRKGDDLNYLLTTRTI